MTTLSSRRLLRDVTDCIQNKELEEQGIWYRMEDSLVSKGYALIKGNEGTPYESFFGLFKFEFPSDYPFNPPKVQWITSDGRTRFHPQFYVSGNICLSILGTWSGPGWTSAFTLRSLLIILQSMFVENPLACEPGYEKGTLEHSRFKNYRDYVEHQCIKYMLHQGFLWKKGEIRETHEWSLFQEIVEKEWPDIFAKLKQKVLEKQNQEEQVWENLAFEMSGATNWKSLADSLQKFESFS